MQQRLARAERDERCLRTALWLVTVLAMLCGAGLGYEMVFVQDFFQNPTHLATRVFGCVGFAAVICWFGFGAWWLYHRAVANRLHEECRRLLISTTGTAATGDAGCPKDGQDTALEQDNARRKLSSLPLRNAA
jgi:hypothetical protein